jgi:microcystin-dependent protein
MAEPFISEIRMFAGDFAPRGWAFCEGQTLPVEQNLELFGVIGTMYGGDGRSSFNLPDLRGRSPMHAGAGEGLTPRKLGEAGGESETSLTDRHLPVTGSASVALSGAKSNSSVRVVSGGGTAVHSNAQPFLAVSYIIALAGRSPLE